MVTNIVLIGFVVIALLMTFLILLQEGQGGGLAALGGTKAAGVEGVTNPIRRATGYLSAIFFILAVLLGVLNRPDKSGFKGESAAVEAAAKAAKPNEEPAAMKPTIPSPPAAAPNTPATPAGVSETKSEPAAPANAGAAGKTPEPAMKSEKPDNAAALQAQTPKTEEKNTAGTLKMPAAGAPTAPADEKKPGAPPATAVEKPAAPAQ